MKKILLLAFLLASCTQTKLPVQSPDSIAIIVNGDTIGVNKQADGAFIKVHEKYDSLLDKEQYLDSMLYLLSAKNDSLKTALFRANYKLVRARYYDSLCLINPKNEKYLTGWIRALFE